MDPGPVLVVADKVIELAPSVKHSTSPTRWEAGIAADTFAVSGHIASGALSREFSDSERANARRDIMAWIR
jgi:hypothetical protein